MSINFWKSTLTPRPDLVDVLKPLIEISKRKNKVITIFDIESTTFMGRHNFGITDLGMVHINPRGSVATGGNLINPENKIDPEVSKLTGIKREMLTHQHNWAYGWGEAITFIAKEHIVVGFNSSTFDKPALISQHSRYGLDALEFIEHWDARNLYKAAAKTQKGKLKEVADWLGIDTTRFEGHRAVNDAVMTAIIFAKLWEKYPEHHHVVDESLKPVVKTKPTPAPLSVNPLKTTVSRRTHSEAKSQSERLRECVLQYYNHPARPASFDESDLLAMLKVLSPDLDQQESMKKSLSFALSNVLDKGELPVLRPGNEDKRNALKNLMDDKEILELITKTWKAGERLAPVHAILQEKYPAQELNYIDVRWVLHEIGVRPLKTVVFSPSP